MGDPMSISEKKTITTMNNTHTTSNTNQHQEAQLIVVCGPSGVGKGTLNTMLFQKHPSQFGFSVSHTTRGPRPGEVDGVDYHFVDKDGFGKLLKDNCMLEHAHVHGNMYGTSKQAVKSVIAAGKSCILDIDVQGAESIHQMKQNGELPFGATWIFILPPSIEQLEKRLRDRGTETEEKIVLRMNNAIGEIQKAGCACPETGKRVPEPPKENTPTIFDHFIYNDNQQQAFNELEKLVMAVNDSATQLAA